MSVPVGVLPFEPARVDNFARAVNSIRLIPGSRIGNSMLALDLETISVARLGFGYELEPALFRRRHIEVVILNLQHNARCVGGP